MTVLGIFIRKLGSKITALRIVAMQEPDFLIRRAAKKVTFIADLRKNMRVCECVCILSMYMIHVVIVLGIFIRKFM